MKLVVLLSVLVAMVAAIPPHTDRPREAKTPEEQAGSWPEARPAIAFVHVTELSTQTLAQLLNVVLVVEPRLENYGDVFNGCNQQGSRDTTIQIDRRFYGRSGLQDSTGSNDVFLRRPPRRINLSSKS
ncbi:hypothetical protein K456DRAFT_37091 [Colletotrichum gloeosporioides 23]|nr:hypothetical protein K456DRAFT_37091 [Colletotrichum gloeosporioides 23]